MRANARVPQALTGVLVKPMRPRCTHSVLRVESLITFIASCAFRNTNLPITYQSTSPPGIDVLVSARFMKSTRSYKCYQRSHHKTCLAENMSTDHLRADRQKQDACDNAGND
eukprot:1194215-Prorocentrum_minimum.AAC.4